MNKIHILAAIQQYHEQNTSKIDYIKRMKMVKIIQIQITLLTSQHMLNKNIVFKY